MFITYEEYKGLGYSAINKDEFDKYARQAKQFIMSRTMNRAKLGAGFDEELKESTAIISEMIVQNKPDSEKQKVLTQYLLMSGWMSAAISTL